MLTCNVCGRDDFKSSGGLTRHFNVHHEADVMRQWHARWELTLGAVQKLEKIDPIRRVEEWAVEVSKYQEVFTYAGTLPSSSSHTHEGPLPDSYVSELIVPNEAEPSAIPKGKIPAPEPTAILVPSTHTATLPEPPPVEVEASAADPAPAPEQPPTVWGRLVSLKLDDVPTIDLIVKGGDGTETRTPAYLVGRHRTCNVILPFVAVSNRHCLIYKETRRNANTGQLDSTFFIEDLSRNGTFVNTTLLARRRAHRLNEGDRISFGHAQKHTFMFRTPTVEPPRPRFTDKYNVGKSKFSGKFTAVRLADDRANAKKVAIKIVTRPRIPGDEVPKFGENFGAEGRLLQTLIHPHITSTLDIWWKKGQMKFVLEHASGGDFYDAITKEKKFPEHIARDVMRQLFQALQYLHERNVAHCNLKLENIFLRTPRKSDKDFFDVQISDFVLPRMLGERAYTATLCGTPTYVAPEVLKSHTGEKGSSLCYKAADMWSCGVILYICLCGYPPFSEELAPPTMKEQIMKGKFNFRRPWWSSMSQASLELITGLLTVDPSKRMTAEQALQHPWMTLKHPTRDIDGVKTLDREYPADYLWPQSTAGMETEGNRVVPALTRFRPSTKRGAAAAAEPPPIAKRRKPVEPMSAAPAAESSTMAPPHPNNAAELILDPALAQSPEQQRSAPLTQTTMILTPRATPAPGTNDDHDDGMPVQSQSSSWSYREPAAPSQQKQSQQQSQQQREPGTPRPGKRRATTKRDLIVTPAGSASSPHYARAVERKLIPAAGRGGAASIPELAAVALALEGTVPESSPDDHRALTRKRPRTPEVETPASAPVMPAPRRSTRIKIEKKRE
ncbi:hypothetical protein HDU88_008573 [Geranomyces variabilis]|nr:hypothetical protein HDU88_008573 [Geranomyces variabilis]